jgi:ring-1,2-phenylacetyl-CoA epoxidase subunit PaaE
MTEIRPVLQDDDSQAPCEVTLIVDGAEECFTMPSDGGDSIIAAAIEAGLEPPHGCLEGICSSCRARVIEGDVVSNDALGLNAADRAAGFILACQARPCSRKLVLSFDNL